MALYHKCGDKNAFTFAIQFFMLISDSLGCVYTVSVVIRNGPIRNTSEILGFFKKRLVELSKLRNGKFTLQICKKLTSDFFLNIRNGFSLSL